MIRVNLLRTHEDLARKAFYRWWTVTAWHHENERGVKLGPVTFVGYIWFDGRLRISLICLGGHEHILWGGPLA